VVAHIIRLIGAVFSSLFKFRKNTERGEEMKSLTKLSLILRYLKGSFTYSNLRLGASDAALYELGGAINSLQGETAKSISKVVYYAVTSA
jgi:hypothetical protein